MWDSCPFEGAEAPLSMECMERLSSILGTVDGAYTWIRSGMWHLSATAFQTGCAHTEM